MEILPFELSSKIFDNPFEMERYIANYFVHYAPTPVVFLAFKCFYCGLKTRSAKIKDRINAYS